ncbi:MAG: 1-deoxy-D-xylulose-5-phosphate synthase [Mucinivorans sp.]
MEVKNKKYLELVNSPEDLRRLSIDELPLYCNELRQFIVSQVSINPGHLGSSLGALEIAVAIHYVYNTPNDRLIWDVGHQAYAHKIITGRRDVFNTNRRYGGISGFPRRSESPYDAFGVGHASTSISAAVGMAAASHIKGENRKVIAVIGDGSMSGGLAFEGLNNVGDHDVLVILNDNNISIDPNVGALKESLLSLTTSKGYNRFKNRVWRALGFWPFMRRTIQKIEHGAKSFFLHHSNLFEALKFRYFGPIDGNDVVSLVKRLQDLRDIPGPKLLHALTVKGKGYAVAEARQTEWHAPGLFDSATGIKTDKRSNTLRFQEVFGYTILALAHDNDKIVGITPAMPSGSSLNLMMNEMPDRAFDVGIAEGHAVTFSAGLAAEGLMPFCNIYSSFAQRSIDNIIHDVALQKLEVVFCLDRAGLVGEDGATHHGVFDIALLRSIPNVIIAAPSSELELRQLMYTASLGGYGACFVIRYPRGGAFDKSVLDLPFEKIEIGLSRLVSQGSAESKVVILSLGSTFDLAVMAAKELNATHYDLRFAKPLDNRMLLSLPDRYLRIIVLEDGVRHGGVASAIAEFYGEQCIDIQVCSIGIEDQFIEHGPLSTLWHEAGLTVDHILAVARASEQGTDR